MMSYFDKPEMKSKFFLQTLEKEEKTWYNNATIFMGGCYMLFKDYYKILGFETNKIAIDEVKIAYREQAKKYHPDLNEGSMRSRRTF